MPRLCICIPTYNRADILADRLERMAAMQDVLELEISISDNASGDHTREVAEQFRSAFARFHYIRQERLISPTLNFYAPLFNATFDYVIQIGDDDTILPQIRDVLMRLEEDASLQAVVGNFELFDFGVGQSRGVKEFVTKAERYDIRNAHAMFVHHFFLEFAVMRREPPQRYFHNEGYSYPTGWKLLYSCLREGAIALEPVSFLRKDKTHSSDRLGRRNYLLEIQDMPRADAEWSAALLLPHTQAGARAALYQAGMMRTAGYAANGIGNAVLHHYFLTAAHYAQKAAIYGLPNGENAKNGGGMILNRLAQWIVREVQTCAGIKEIVMEVCPVSDRLTPVLQQALPGGIAVFTVPLEKLRAARAASFRVSLHFDRLCADNAEASYCALTDLVAACCDKPADYVPMRQWVMHPS